MRTSSTFILGTVVSGIGLLALLTVGCDGIMPKRSQGEKLYRKHCADCHGVDASGQTIRSMGDPHANLLDDMWRHPSGDMGMRGVLAGDAVFEHPTFSRKLSQEEIKQIVHHVLVLRGDRLR